ncbi:ABC transporter substrate-binding protein [Paenibacillus sp. 32352]|uniref:ABC transporter substrate-binding protein n=1 Tax=Paenibacillus sp. 32352 TaxID=1969111 RepID=UPI0015C46749|nr:extracellular solute-binding protein [Paenibacillus sp. 32352]
MNARKSWTMPLIVMSSGMLLLNACTSNDTSAPGGEAPNGGGKTIELNVMVMLESDGDEAERKSWESIAKTYSDSHPGVKVNLQMQSFAGVEQHRTWVTTQLIGKTAPDLFTTRYIWDQEDLKKGLLVDLTPYYKQKTAYSGDQTWEKLFPPTILQQLIGDDKTYASAPNYVNSVRVLYNKDLFAQAGITNVPKTWNEFLDAQEKLLKINVVPFAFPNSKPGDYNYNWTIRILTEELLAGSYDKLDIDKSGFIEVNEYVRGVDQGIIDIEKAPFKDVFPIVKNWSKYWPKGYNGLDFETAGDLFLRGKAAMVMRTSGQSKALFETSARKFEMAAFPLPYLTKENHPDAIGKLMEIGGVPAGNMAIPKTIAPEKMEAAVDFLAYTTSPKVQGLLAESLYRTPVIANAALPDKLKGFQFVGERMQLNIYAGEVDKNVTEYNQKLGQLYLEGSSTLDKYISELKKLMVDGARKKMSDNNWTKENNYGIKMP